MRRTFFSNVLSPKSTFLPSIALSVALLIGCTDSRARYGAAESALKLDRVVLYRNGIGYFERSGDVEGDVLTIKVRKDQVNDLLKSLTVVDRATGKAVSVSMPLDPQSWANAAIATLAPGRGNLADVLDALRGTRITASTTDGSVSGRITLVEEIVNEPDEVESSPGVVPPTPPRTTTDHRVTLIDGNEMHVVRLSKVRGITLEDGDLAMQINRTLDASAGEGMYQQVDVSIRLTGPTSHKLLVSYVAAAPMWKPTYRVVLPKEKKGKALLQGWAVVDNTSGEEWNKVSLGLTSGAPIAFRYDLHTPRDVPRSDLTESGVRRQAQAMLGESTFEPEETKPAEQPPQPTPMADAPAPPPGVAGNGQQAMKEDDSGGFAGDASRASRSHGGKGKASKAGELAGKDGNKRPPAKAPMTGTTMESELRAQDGKSDSGAVDFDALRRSTLAQARTASVSGLTRFDIDSRVTIPEGTSTMVAIINADVEGEETFLYRPGGAGMGYEANPYRVVRFKNATPFVLEPGPISIYAGGSFVGEGLSDAVGTNTSATIPFAVEPGIMVTTGSKYEGDEMRLVKISRGILEIESFARKVTTYSVKAQTMNDGFNVLIRHPKAGWNYELTARPDGTEDLPDAYLLKITVPAGKKDGTLSVTEQTPSRREISIWDSPALPLLEKLMLVTDLTPEIRAKLQPIVDRRREIGKIDEQIDGLKRQRDVNDQRANETRQNLESIQKDQAAAALRSKLTKRLDDFSNEGNRLGRDMAELERQRMEKRIELEDMLQDLDVLAPPAKKGQAGAAVPSAPADVAPASAGAAPTAAPPSPPVTPPAKSGAPAKPAPKPAPKQPLPAVAPKPTQPAPPKPKK